MWGVSDNRNNMYHIYAKELLHSNFLNSIKIQLKLNSYTKYKYFNEIAPNFT